MDELSPYRDDLREQAADWFACIFLGEPTEAEELRFAEWYQADPLNREAYQSMIVVWDDMGQLEPQLTDVTNLKENCVKPIAETTQSETTGQATSTHPIKASYTLTSALAACVFCVLAVTAFLWPNNPSAHEYKTGIAEKRVVALPDGSQVSLSAQTHLSFSTDNNGRHVKLTNGQAYFKVKTLLDNQKEKVPFSVTTIDAEVNVVGTAFEVNMLEAGTSIAIEEGAVIVVTPSKHQASLTQGQKVLVQSTKPEPIGEVEAVNPNSVAGWRKGRLIYVDAPLSEVISDARRFHHGSIVLAEEELGGLRVTAAFRTDQIQEMTIMLEQLLPVKVYREQNGKRITFVSKRPVN